MGSSEFEVIRDTTVDAPPPKVYELLADFRQWRQWSPWEDLDPELQRTYSGAASGVGAVYEWAGNRKAGAGRMEITAAEPTSRVVIALQFLKPFKSQSTTTFTVEPAASGSHVTWRMVGPKTFMTRVMGVFTSMDKMIGPDFEKGLAQLADAARR